MKLSTSIHLDMKSHSSFKILTSIGLVRTYFFYYNDLIICLLIQLQVKGESGLIIHLCTVC